VENEFPNDTKEEEQLTEGSEPYFPLPAFPQDDISGAARENHLLQ
jgi:hypothetical protein